MKIYSDLPTIDIFFLECYAFRKPRKEGNFVILKDKNQMAPFVSGGLVIVNIILFLLCTFGCDLLYNKGGLSPYNFGIEKEYYRIVTSMFLHADIEHLVNNMLLLFGLGAMIEKEVGHLSFAILYFIC